MFLHFLLWVIITHDTYICNSVQITWWVIIQNGVTHTYLQNECPQQLLHMWQQWVGAATAKTKTLIDVNMNLLARYRIRTQRLTVIIKYTPYWQECWLGDLKHKSLDWAMLLVHDDNNHLLRIILRKKWHRWDANDRCNMVSPNQPPHRSVNYLLNEWLHAMECILNILIQLWVAWHLWEMISRP